VESEEFDGCSGETRLKYYRNVRGFYAYNLVPLPSSKLGFRKREGRVPVQVTALQFLEIARKVVCYGGLN